ncbi:hypothetical protein CBR_g12247 [Chara braunii]|uniref:Uncharacterized protein n=1 Tax=Chara braunii TaxID=69332 RepID=A0A388KRQ3_CHABU|nr:hypothetical protein CBR_g12247 [Chara braunii]|eukprot:GBG72678.1 hypothetical protein CBR_g12247 [Chara braunii]
MADPDLVVNHETCPKDVGWGGTGDKEVKEVGTETEEAIKEDGTKTKEDRHDEITVMEADQENGPMKTAGWDGTGDKEVKEGGTETGEEVDQEDGPTKMGEIGTTKLEQWKWRRMEQWRKMATERTKMLQLRSARVHMTQMPSNLE